jgi:16S rRNA (uracil1498-N3)-methyltransferase
MLLEKCTELGVGLFIPILTEHVDPSSVRDLTRDMVKLQAQTVEASEQCERLTVPPLSTSFSEKEAKDPWTLSTLLNEWSTLDIFKEKQLLICRERTAPSSVPVLKLLEHLHTNDVLTRVAFVVGPEGGWSTAEEELCDQYTSRCTNIHCVSLGSSILRAETAAIAAASAYMLREDAFNTRDIITDDRS